MAALLDLPDSGEDEGDATNSSARMNWIGPISILAIIALLVAIVMDAYLTKCTRGTIYVVFILHARVL